MTTVDIAYKKLLSEELPRTIHTEKEYRSYCMRLEELMDKRSRSAAEDRYMELLAVLIEQREEEYCPVLPPDPRDALKELMLVHRTTQAELGALLGSSGITSEILAGKRALSKTHIKILSEHFHVPADVLL